jgi:hypothetical protein
LIINALYGKELFIEGLNFVYTYQLSQSSSVIRVFQNLVSIISSTGINVTIGIYYLLTKRKLLSIIHISAFYFGMYLISILDLSF